MCGITCAISAETDGWFILEISSDSGTPAN